jgi:hypothetical protein
MDVSGYVPAEWTSIYHLLQAQRRQQMQVIMEITNTLGLVHRTHTDILGIFLPFFSEKLDTIMVEDLASTNWGTRYMD